MQQLRLWDEKPIRIRSKKNRPLTLHASYSITANDCEIIGHTVQVFDLAGCSLCLDCQVKLFCPRCISAHPTDAKAIPVLCSRHEES